MTRRQLLQELKQYQQQLLQLCQSSSAEYNISHHPDLSPIGWHLGHCIFTENYWVREKFLQHSPCDGAEIGLYNPFVSDKQSRGESLPPFDDLYKWAQKSQAENCDLLEKYADHKDELALMEENYLIRFLIQHYAQHSETIKLCQCQAIKNNPALPVNSGALQSIPVTPSTRCLYSDHYHIGNTHTKRPYDNEHPAFTVEINHLHISSQPVSNAEYLGFIEAGGYHTPDYWSDEGWSWVATNNVACPEYWQQGKDGGWSVIALSGKSKLDPFDAVYGISYYEATAFAHWAGARLPHEIEWEAACKNDLLQDTGQVWEWCQNRFYPYEGFNDYPYDGYSSPYFDGTHFSLRGGSRLTSPVIKRPTFRNYYQADKRFIHAGLRLVFNNG